MQDMTELISRTLREMYRTRQRGLLRFHSRSTNRRLFTSRKQVNRSRTLITVQTGPSYIYAVYRKGSNIAIH